MQDSGDQNADKAYAALKAGNLDDARKFLAAVMPAAASDPVAMYVRAALDQNAIEAVDIYKEIVAENPGKPIGHDALLQLYKYHFAAGEYKAAHTDYLELQRYPDLSRAGASTGQLIDPAGFKDSIQTGATFNDPQSLSGTNAPHAGNPTGGVAEFVVQTGVFSTLDNAREFAEQLRSKTVDAAVFTKSEDGKTLYAVSAGAFSTREAAETFANELKNRSINCIVVQK